MQLVSELVIGRSHLENQIERLESLLTYQQLRPLQESSSALERKLRRLREGVMRLRMVPVRDLFERMKFVARDVARDHGKNVRTDITGEWTEIDRLLLEKVSDAVLHLVRNGVAHGIEPEKDRLAAGKGAQGTLTLKASTEGDEVTLVVADDGCGIDAGAMEKEAIKVGLIRSGQVFDETALLELICRPGFTTASEADLAKGRGVGMAVVKKSVLELGGSVTLSTTPGAGTSFSIRLPLTLSIVDALIVSVGPQTFAIPIGSVREIVEVDPGSLTKLEKNELVAYRGGVLPLIRLSEAFEIPGEERQGLYVLVTGSEHRPVGIGVDRLIGQTELVVRSLEDRLIAVPGFSGAAEIGDGRVALILDVQALIRTSVDKRASFT
jgi:two-component system chemotaxis sensor kinase CheA